MCVCVRAGVGVCMPYSFGKHCSQESTMYFCACGGPVVSPVPPRRILLVLKYQEQEVIGKLIFSLISQSERQIQPNQVYHSFQSPGPPRPIRVCIRAHTRTLTGGDEVSLCFRVLISSRENWVSCWLSMELMALFINRHFRHYHLLYHFCLSVF